MTAHPAWNLLLRLALVALLAGVALGAVAQEAKAQKSACEELDTANQLDKEKVGQILECLASQLSGEQEKQASKKEPVCEGPYDAKELDAAELKRVLERHREWFRAEYEFPSEDKWLNDPRRANLCRTNFYGANLTGVSLQRANFTGALLDTTNLTGATLNRADLEGAALWQAVLTNASLVEANFTGAKLQGANLTDASLGGADLTGANLWRANLTGASLVNADLAGASLVGADLAGAVFEPKVETLPPVTSFLNAKNLGHMRYRNSPHVLVELRKRFKEAGWREQERQITHAIKHTEIDQTINPLSYFLEDDARARPNLLEQLDAWFKFVFFELTTQWGMNPGRALQIMLGLVGVFALAYMFSISGISKTPIARVWPKERIDAQDGEVELGADDTVDRLTATGFAVLGYALYFSLLSAFHFGWRDLNVGNWIARIQPRQYTLRATGWVRMVSGTQSLISVYLVAIWVLTYFGRPFE